MFNLLRNFQTVSTVAALLYISTSRHRDWSFSPTFLGFSGSTVLNMVSVRFPKAKGSPPGATSGGA